MNPTKQTILHDPDNGKFGNCLSATLATLLHIPIDDVPVFQLPYPQWHIELNAWLKQYGLAYVSFGDWKEWSTETGITGLYHEITGKTVRNSEVLHSCVGKDGELFFDPHPDDTGLEEITSSGLFIALEPWKLAAIANKPEGESIGFEAKEIGTSIWFKVAPEYLEFYGDSPRYELRELYTAPPSTAALQKRIEELEADQPLPEQFYLNYIRTLQSALKRLSFAAQTSGGTSGKDDELMAAIEQAGEALKFKAAAQAYGDVQAPKEGWKLVPIEPTDEMVDKAVYQDNCGNLHSVSDVYKAMIASAPTDTEAV